MKLKCKVFFKNLSLGCGASCTSVSIELALVFSLNNKTFTLNMNIEH